MMKMPLKESLYRMAARRTGAAAMDDASFRACREERLAATLEYVRKNARFYRERFSGVDIGSVHIGDLSGLPFTTAADLSADPFSFLCLSQAKAERAISFESSGTLGPRKRLFFTGGDIDAATDFMACGMSTVASPGQAVQILLPGGPAGGQADLLRAGVAKMGGVPVVTGMDMPFPEQVRTIRERRSKVLFGETHLLYRLTKEMEREGGLAALGVECIFVTTSYCSPVMRAYLERVWNAAVSTHYGMTEMGLGVAVECHCCHGMHYNEFGVVLEVVDPLTGEPKPPGCPGEVVATSLGREAMPIIRFRTGDIASLRPASPGCPCSPMPVLSQVAYRQAARVRLADGTAIHPTFFHDALFGVPEVVDYEVAVERDGRRDLLSFDVELLDGACDGEAVRRKAARRVEDALEAAGAIDMPESAFSFVSHERLRQGRHFKKLVQDRR